jgi:hypothetical protein
MYTATLEAFEDAMDGKSLTDMVIEIRFPRLHLFTPPAVSVEYVPEVGYRV